MNPFLNPILLSKVIKNYFMEPNRLRRMNNDDIIRYQNKMLKSVVKYAYTVPMYREKYLNAGVHPSDIRGTVDIKKLPLISKEDFTKNFPNKVIPSSFDRKSGIIAATSGTTGRSLSLYFDMYTMIRSMLGFVRAFQEHNINWKKTKMTLLFDLSENSFENEYLLNSIFSSAKFLVSTNKMQIIDILDSPLEIIKKIDKFQPEVIIGYPFVIIQLNILKSKGFGRNIKPRYIVTSGAFFDMHSRKNVEEVFNTRIFDIYAATESGIMAFECKNGKYHICSDLVYTEFMKNGSDVCADNPGSIVITKLYGKGTPLIRYSGLEDVVTPSKNDCTCNLAGDTLEKIHGRKSNTILLPNGKMVFGSLFENIIGESLFKIRINKIKRIQIIQHKLNRIELRILFDEQLRDKCQPAENLLFTIKSKLQKRLGTNISVDVIEADRMKTRASYIVSKVDRNKFLEKEYIV